MIKEVFIDLETYSSEDITKVGAYKYCSSPDFEIIILCYAVDDEPVIKIDLLSGEKIPEEFIEYLYDSRIKKHAHNAAFERNCFRAIGIDVPIDQWYCTAVESGYHGLPLSLADVSAALELDEFGKKTTGKALIKLFSMPAKPTRANPHKVRNYPHEFPTEWKEYKTYCKYDVISERKAYRTFHLKITVWERRNYILDQTINDRGIKVDLFFANRAVEIDNKNAEILTDRLFEITKLENPNSPKQLKDWFMKETGKEITSLSKESIPEYLEIFESEDAKEVLRLRQKAAKTSTKKYVAMSLSAGYDNRIRGLFQFYGANRTGRWAGRLVQLQNLPQNKVKNIDIVRSDFREKNFDNLHNNYDNISDMLSQLIRTAFIAEEGKTFLVADFSAIEARVIAWIADERWRLEVFATHGKIYEASASMMFNIPLEEITTELRSKGKVAELALGYQGSVGALQKMGGEKMGLSTTEMKNIVDLWRLKNKKIVDLWDTLNTAAINCLMYKREVVIHEFKNITFSYSNECMTILLPSGRVLAYQKAELTSNRWGHLSIRYKGLDQVTKKWWWIDSYGGKFAENIVQAIARDILADSMQRLHEKGFDLVMHVHDEAIAESDKINAEEKLKEMCEIMGTEISWAPGLPLRADGYVTEYYMKKD